MTSFKKLFQIILISIVAVVVTSCCGPKKATTDGAASGTKTAKEQAIQYEKDGYVPATVIRFTLDGCQYLLQLKSGKRLEAMNLAEELKQDKLDIWIKYEPSKAMSICMAGEIVTLTDYKVIK